MADRESDYTERKSNYGCQNRLRRSFAVISVYHVSQPYRSPAVGSQQDKPEDKPSGRSGDDADSTLHSREHRQSDRSERDIHNRRYRAASKTERISGERDREGLQRDRHTARHRYCDKRQHRGYRGEQSAQDEIVYSSARPRPDLICVHINIFLQTTA